MNKKLLRAPAIRLRPSDLPLIERLVRLEQCTVDDVIGRALRHYARLLGALERTELAESKPSTERPPSQASIAVTIRRCPKCNSDQIVPIAYGAPSSQVDQDVRAGKVVCGGTVLSDDSPDHACKNCGHTFDGV